MILGRRAIFKFWINNIINRNNKIMKLASFLLDNNTITYYINNILKKKTNKK